MPPGLRRLRRFVDDLGAVLADDPSEPAVLARGGDLLADLVATDDWLPDPWAASDPERYQQHLLHCDPRGAFSVVSFVWGPGQATPIHDHRTWGLVGVLRGAESVTRYSRGDDGALVAEGPAAMARPGHIDAVSPTVGDLHQVANASHDVSVSIHVYGADIGAVERAVYRPDGTEVPFVSGYSNRALPNIYGQDPDDPARR